MSNFLHIPYKIAVLHDYFRSINVDVGDHAKLISSYVSQKFFFPDGNTGEFWDFKFRDSVEERHLMAKNRNRVISNYLIGKKGRWLNIGIGNGDLEKKCFRNRNFFLDYVGSDITNDRLAQLKKQYPQKKLIKCRIEELQNNLPKPFSIISLLEVYEHLRPVSGLLTLRMIKRMLTAKGVLILSVPINESLSLMLPSNPNQHMRILTIDLVKAELNLCGFRVERTEQYCAFSSAFMIKHIFNKFLPIRSPNNVVLYCSKKT